MWNSSQGSEILFVLLTACLQLRFAVVAIGFFCCGEEEQTLFSGISSAITIWFGGERSTAGSQINGQEACLEREILCLQESK